MQYNGSDSVNIPIISHRPALGISYHITDPHDNTTHNILKRIAFKRFSPIESPINAPCSLEDLFRAAVEVGLMADNFVVTQENCDNVKTDQTGN